MTRIGPAVGVTFAMLIAGTTTISGAEINPIFTTKTVPAVRHVETQDLSTCRAARKCNRYGCDWYKICPRRCPDRYSCSPLYGAYGPYGGVGYWAAYTVSAWGAR